MKTLLPIILPVLSLAISLAFTFSIIDLARKKRLFEANNALKNHTEQVSSLGGIAFFSAFWIVLFLSGITAEIPSAEFLFAGAFFLFLAGVKDDLVGIPALKRLLIQVVVASTLFFGGVRLGSFPGMEGELPFLVSYFLTILLMGGIVNALNFIDGINGLASGLSILSLLAFGGIFYLSGELPLAMVTLILASAVLGFFRFNFGKARIFMGDNGSTFLGVMLSFFLIRALDLIPEGQPGLSFSPALPLAILLLPMMDMAKVLTGRLLRGKSPFKGDRTHIHHLLFNRGMSDRRSCYLLYSWHVIIILFSLLFLSRNIWLALGTLFIAGNLPYLALNLLSRFKWERSEMSSPLARQKDASLKTLIH